MKKKPEATILKHSTYFLTFGNSEVVVKPMGTVTSIFGTAQTYFDNGEDRVDKLFGENSREVKYEEVEVHQLFFD